MSNQDEQEGHYQTGADSCKCGEIWPCKHADNRGRRRATTPRDGTAITPTGTAFDLADIELGTINGELTAHADGFARATMAGWDKMQAADREPYRLVRQAYLAGAEMAKVAIESRARAVAIIARRSTGTPREATREPTHIRCTCFCPSCIRMACHDCTEGGARCANTHATFRRSNGSPDAGADYETCAGCGKHISRHYGAGVAGLPLYRCYPAVHGEPTREPALLDAARKIGAEPEANEAAPHNAIIRPHTMAGAPFVVTGGGTIVGCTCGWKAPPGEGNQDDAYAAHIGLATNQDAPSRRI